METNGNIVIGDESALHLYMHSDTPERLHIKRATEDPLFQCAASSEELSIFNADNPLYGPRPIRILVSSDALKRKTADFECAVCGVGHSDGAFFKLRQGLYVASPELVLVRLARRRSEVKIAEMALNLCGRYYLDIESEAITRRSAFVVRPDRIKKFINCYPSMRGAKKLQRVLKWVVPNSGSPFESKAWITLCAPPRVGGYGLPLDAMNYDVKPGRLQSIAAQQNYSIDLVNVSLRFGVEYDGEEYHENASKDKQRRNELAALGWTIFPLDKEVLNSFAATDRMALQIARQLGVRIRKTERWAEKHAQLRKELGLPT